MFRFYKLYSLYMNNSNLFSQKQWCVCEKLPRAVLHVPVSRYNVCDVCGLSRCPRSRATGSSDEEEKLDVDRQIMLLQRRRDEEAAQSNKGARFKVSVKGKKPQAKTSCKRNSGKSDGMARTAGGGNGEAGDGCPERAEGKLLPKPNKMDCRHEEPSAPPPSSPSPPPAPSGSPREEMHAIFGRKRLIYDNQAVKKFTPLKAPITDPSGGAISKMYGNTWGASSSHLSRPQAPLSTVQNKQKTQGGDLSSTKPKPKYTDSQLASQFTPFEDYEGPSEDALVVDEARRMLSRPNSLYMEQRPDLPNNRIGNYGSSLGGFWVSPRTMPPAPAPKPASGPSTDKSPESEETKADIKERSNSSSSSSIQADGAEEAGNSEEQPAENSKYDEILECFGLIKLSNEGEGATVDEIANDNVVSSNKTRNDEEYSQVLSSKKKSASREFIRTGGFLLKRKEEKMKESRNCNKCEGNVRNHEEREPRKRSEVLSRAQKSNRKVYSRIGGSLLKSSEQKMITVKEKILESNKCELNVRSHDEREPSVGSEVFSRVHSAESKESIRTGGSLLKRRKENIITASQSKSSTLKEIKCECNVKNHEERETREISVDRRKLQKPVSAKYSTVKYNSSKEPVCPAPRKKCTWTNMSLCKPQCRQSIAPTNPLSKREDRVPFVTKKQAKVASRVLPVTRKQKPEARKLVSGNIESFETVYYYSGEIPMPQTASFVRQLAGSLSKSCVQNQRTMSLFEFRVPDINLSDLEDFCQDSSNEVPHVRLTRKIKYFESAYHRSGDLLNPTMAYFVKQLMGNLSESYVQNQPAIPPLNLSKVVPRDFKEDNSNGRETPKPHVATPKGPVSLIPRIKMIGRPENKRIRGGEESSSSKCTTCRHHFRNHEESDPRKRSGGRDSTRKDKEAFTEPKYTASKNRVCLVNSGASASLRCRQRMNEMETKKYTWEDLLVLSEKIASRKCEERLLVTGNIETFETVYCYCGEIPMLQTASLVRQLAGNLLKSNVRKPTALTFFEFRVPDIDPSELQLPCRDDSHENNASRPESPISHITSPERHDRSNLQTKKKARAVWPHWSMMQPSEVFVSQKKSLIQKEEVVTRIIYDQNSSQSDSLEEKPARQKKKKSRLKLMEETKWKRYDQVEELEIKHEKRSRILAPEPELNSETCQDSVSKGTAPKEILEVAELGENNPSTATISLKLNTKNERYPFVNDSKEIQVLKQNPEKFSEMFGIDSDTSLEPKITHRTTLYPELPALNWQVISLEKAKPRLSTGEGKECKCPIYKCKDSLTPKSLATHFQRDHHRNTSEETYHRVVEGLPTQFSFNCENMTNGNNLVTLLLYSSIRKETPRRSSPMRDYPLVLLAAPDIIKNGLPTGIFFWLVGCPTEAKLVIKLSVSKPLEFKGSTRIIQPRDISRRQNPHRFCPDSRDHLLLELPCKKQDCIQMCLVVEEDVNNFRS